MVFETALSQCLWNAACIVHDEFKAVELELQLRTLTGTSINGVPVISNREYKGSIALKEGEPAVIAGMISRLDQHSLTGLPYVSRVPGLNQVSSTNGRQENDDELLIVITPHIVREQEASAKEIWLK